MNLRGIAVVCVWLFVVAMAAPAIAEEKEYVKITCEPNGRQFTCTAINADKIDGVPFWRLYSQPLDSGYGYAYTGPRETPLHWTLLVFTLKDSKNNIELKILVRRNRHTDKIEFAATDTDQQHVEQP